ncbi:hypothetical protein BJ508DRAFT_312999 [Ascobolus immersus RN42]|uniref:Prolyl 4-hydroxylase alpha subunit domain-containing protein n=1 Tax=Ascobolus immersus RN42 TaxID=1160509 RepID=A0A3N4HN04_ASCIM|nr:hypothetical protein BJ508DRAFT_312999 [Ascobolus immersus RN42]
MANITNPSAYQLGPDCGLSEEEITVYKELAEILQPLLGKCDEQASVLPYLPGDDGYEEAITAWEAEHGKSDAYADRFPAGYVSLITHPEPDGEGAFAPALPDGFDILPSITLSTDSTSRSLKRSADAAFPPIEALSIADFLPAAKKQKRRTVKGQRDWGARRKAFLQYKSEKDRTGALLDEGSELYYDERDRMQLRSDSLPSPGERTIPTIPPPPPSTFTGFPTADGWHPPLVLWNPIPEGYRRMETIDGLQLRDSKGGLMIHVLDHGAVPGDLQKSFGESFEMYRKRAPSSTSKEERGDYNVWHLGVWFSPGSGPGYEAPYYAKEYRGDETAFRTMKNIPHRAAKSFIRQNQRLWSCISTLLGRHHPEIAEQYEKLTLPFRRKKCFGCFCTMALNEACTTEPHWDHIDNRNGVCCVYCFGQFHGGELVFPELKLVIPLRPGQLVFFRSALLVHGNLPVLHGERHSFVLFSGERLMGWRKHSMQQVLTRIQDDLVPAVKERIWSVAAKIGWELKPKQYWRRMRKVKEEKEVKQEEKVKVETKVKEEKKMKQE